MNIRSLFLLLTLSVAAFAFPQTPARPHRDGARPPRQQSSETSESHHPVIEDDDVVRVTTALVAVPVVVSDLDGRYIANLRREEFRIYEDGVEQQITYFSNTEQPLRVVLLMDTSLSTENHLSHIKEAAVAFVEQTRPGDEVLPVSFDGGVRSLLPEGTGDRVFLRVAIHNMHTDVRNSGTRLYDAVDVAVDALRGVAGRKVIVLFTDGEDTGSAVTRAMTLREATELDALVYSVYYDTKAAFDYLSKGAKSLKVVRRGTPSPQYLRSLSRKTGGRFYNATNPEVLKQTFATIAEELRHQYSIGYHPKGQVHDGRQRHVTVKVNRPGVSVRGRKSYVYEPAGERQPE